MRILAAAAIAAIFVTGPASAQMKASPAPSSQPPVQISTPVLQPQATLESARRIKREEAIKLVAKKKAVIVDVRSKDQYDTEHIKGAVSIPLMEIVSRLKELPPGRMIITYCA